MPPLHILLRLPLLGLPLLGLCLASCQPSTPPNRVQPLPTAATLPTAPPAVPPAPSPGAPSIARVDLGNAVGSDHRVLLPMLHFAPTDTIHAALLLAGHASEPHRVDARWSHLDSKQTFLTESKLLPFNGDTATTFQISKPNAWPTGHYKVEILLDGKLVQTRLFDVVDTPPRATP